MKQLDYGNIARLLLVVLIVAVAIYGVFAWVHDSDRTSIADKPSACTKQVKTCSTSQKPKSTATPKQKAATASPSPTAIPPRENSNAATVAGKALSPQLTNTGPGDTVALFAAVVLIATGAHYGYRRHKLAR